MPHKLNKNDPTARVVRLVCDELGITRATVGRAMHPDEPAAGRRILGGKGLSKVGVGRFAFLLGAAVKNGPERINAMTNQEWRTLWAAHKLERY